MELDEEQLAFVESESNANSSLLASAGSGKTEVMTRRSDKLITEGYSVLIFSHANQTVNEITSRLAGQGIEGATVMTMHRFCISRMCSARLTPPTILDELIARAADLFEEGGLWADQSHIIVDEAQDLSPNQMRIIYALMAAGKYVTLTGDPEQSIYGFQGSSPSHLQEFHEGLAEEYRYQIGTNYRTFNTKIVEAANLIAYDDIRSGRAVHMKHRPGAEELEGSLSIIGYRSEYGSGNSLMNILLDKLKEKRGGSIMVLAHSNELLSMAHCHLLANKVAAILHSSARSGEFRRVPASYQRKGVVQCFSIHGSKGGQADHVFLLSGNDRGDSIEVGVDASDSESRRLLYVALTRAIKTFTVFYNDAPKPNNQPCRWINQAWGLFDLFNAKKFTSNHGREYTGNVNIRLTTLLARRGAQGLPKYFEEREEALGKLYGYDVEDLEPSDESSGVIRKQARKAYDMGLEKFIGIQFENHTIAFLCPTELKLKVERTLDRWSRAVVKTDIFTILEKQNSPSRGLFEAWWRSKAGRFLTVLHDDLHQRSHSAVLWEEVSEGCPPEIRKALRDGLKEDVLQEVKYTNLWPLLDHFKMRLAREKLALQGDPSTYVAPAFKSFFRRKNTYLDESKYSSLRQTFSRAFQAARNILHESHDARDLCWFSALECCEKYELEEDEQRSRGDADNSWQAMLHLSQDRSSCIHLSVDQLKLSDEAVDQIREDSAYIQGTLELGTPLFLQGASDVQFSCRQDFGDLELTAHGKISGRCDYMFQDGPLEVKAVLSHPTDDHIAQTLWYALAAGKTHAFLWDVYHRRLLVWKALSLLDARAYFRKCIEEYLSGSPPPGGSAVILPQEVTITRVWARVV